MTKASAVNGTKIKKSTSPCPNLGSGAHTSSNSALASYLTKAQVRSAIAAIDTSWNSKLMRVARWRAFTAGIDAEDLLQEAILRALTSRSCPYGLKTEHFIMAVMRSIASKIIEKRGRACDALLHYGLITQNQPMTPEECLIFDERADICRRSIEKVVAGSATVKAVIDGIDHGLCGAALADFAAISETELAVVRRKIKRRVAGIFAKLEQCEGNT
jgi:hypothetical protein